MSNTFSLDNLADAVKGTENYVTIVYGLDFNIQTPSSTFTTEVATGTALGTVASVLEATGAVAEFQRIDAAMRAKGHSISEGYSISITSADGDERLVPTDLQDALATEVYDGDLISVIGKVSGRN